jgi:hypothetical protein
MKFLKPILFSLLFGAVFAANAGDIRMGITPNPANQQAIISIEGTQATGMQHPEIFTLLGEKVGGAQWRREGNNFIFNTASIPDGMYLVKFSTGEQSIVKRLKIQHL